jgi:hypothetical protein
MRLELSHGTRETGLRLSHEIRVMRYESGTGAWIGAEEAALTGVSWLAAGPAKAGVASSILGQSSGSPALRRPPTMR